MITITIKLDSVDDSSDMDGVSYTCDWEIISPTITLSEKNSAEFILEKIKNIFDEIGFNAMLIGGSVEYLKDGDNEQ